MSPLIPQAGFTKGPHGDIFVVGGRSLDYPEAPKSSKYTRSLSNSQDINRKMA
jgi:hypothetical protein